MPDLTAPQALVARVREKLKAANPADIWTVLVTEDGCAEVVYWLENMEGEFTVCRVSPGKTMMAEADLIACAPAHLAALCDAVERLEAEVERLHGESQ